jgi:hypothetical protein
VALKLHAFEISIASVRDQRHTRDRHEYLLRSDREIHAKSQCGHSAGQIFEHVIHSDAQARTQSLPPLLPGSIVMIPAYVIISLYLKPRAIGIVADRNPVATCWPCVGSLRYHRTGSPLCHCLSLPQFSDCLQISTRTETRRRTFNGCPQ